MKKYPSIVLLEDCPSIYAVKEVIATEKLHGSSFRLFFPLGIKRVSEIGYGSREIEYTPGQDFPLGSMLNWFQKQEELLGTMMETLLSYGFNDTTVFGEAYGPGIKAKGVRYSKGQTPLFRTFGIMPGPNFLTYDLFCEVADKMKLPRVHEVWRGEPTKANFDALLEKPSTEGLLNGFGEDNIAEGIVIQSNPLLRDVFGDWLICKHKCAKFAEKATAPKEKVERGPSPVDDFVATYVTEGRVINAIGRLTDRGTSLTDTMKDMPLILTTVIADLAKDCRREWTELSLNEQAIRGNVSRVLGPLYREMLAKGSAE